jgi:hypothetical protein
LLGVNLLKPGKMEILKRKKITTSTIYLSKVTVPVYVPSDRPATLA